MHMPVMWTPGYAVVILVMWAVMMAAMMLPSAAPMILLYGTIARRREETEGRAVAGTGGLCGRVCGGLAWLQLSSRCPPVCAGACGSSLTDDGCHQSPHRWRGADRGGCLPMDAAEAGVPPALPFTPGVSHDGVARRSARRVRDGSSARSVLPRMLLDAHAAALRRRHHEHGLDCRDRPLRLGRKACSSRALDRKGCWGRTRCVGRTHDSSIKVNSFTSKTGNILRLRDSRWDRSLLLGSRASPLRTRGSSRRKSYTRSDRLRSSARPVQAAWSARSGGTLHRSRDSRWGMYRASGRPAPVVAGKDRERKDRDQRLPQCLTDVHRL